MIYEIYFWKKPSERRLYMSQVCPAPAQLQRLRADGYRIMLGKVDLPDEPEESKYDQVIQVPTRPLTAGVEWVPGGPLWNAEPSTDDPEAFDGAPEVPDHMKMYERMSGNEPPRVGYRVLARGETLPGGDIEGVITALTDESVTVRWCEEWRGVGTFRRSAFEQRVSEASIVLRRRTAWRAAERTERLALDEVRAGDCVAKRNAEDIFGHESRHGFVESVGSAAEGNHMRVRWDGGGMECFARGSLEGLMERGRMIFYRALVERSEDT